MRSARQIRGQPQRELLNDWIELVVMRVLALMGNQIAASLRVAGGLAGLLCLAGASAEVRKIPFSTARSAFGPTVAVMHESVFVAWRGAGSPNSSEDDQQLYLSELRRGQWQEPRALPVKSMFSPALAVHGETLYFVWHGPGNLFTGTGDGNIFFGAYEVGRGFRALGPIPKAMSAGPPSLALYNGRLFASWRGLGNITVGTVSGNEPWLLYAAYDLTQNKWSSEEGPISGIVHANSTAGPGLAVVSGKLYGFWRGTGSVAFYGPNSDPGDSLIYYASFDGTAWSAQNLPLPTIPNAGTAWGASAADWNGRLCVGWRGVQPWDAAKGDQLLHFGVLTSNQVWRPLKLFKTSLPSSAFGPSLAADPRKNELWVAWRGSYDSAQGLDDQALYLASFRFGEEEK